LNPKRLIFIILYYNSFTHNKLKSIDKMNNPKKLGIWMDHSMAHVMEFTDEHFEVMTIESEYPLKGQHQQTTAITQAQHNKQYKYYKKLGEIIKDYYQVILFGPTDAKVELFNLLSDDHRFVKIQVEIKETDRMTRNQLHSFVNEYFTVAH